MTFIKFTIRYKLSQCIIYNVKVRKNTLRQPTFQYYCLRDIEIGLLFSGVSNSTLGPLIYLKKLL